MSLSTALQPAVDAWQGSLFAFDDPTVDPLLLGVERVHLDDESWIDFLPGWMLGADLVFGELVARLPWRQREVLMYERVLPEPRLTAWWTDAAGAAGPLRGQGCRQACRHSKIPAWYLPSPPPPACGWPSCWCRASR